MTPPPPVGSVPAISSAAGPGERALERHAFREQRRVDRFLVLRRARVVLLELLAQLRRQHFDARAASGGRA